MKTQWFILEQDSRSFDVDKDYKIVDSVEDDKTDPEFGAKLVAKYGEQHHYYKFDIYDNLDYAVMYDYVGILQDVCRFHKCNIVAGYYQEDLSYISTPLGNIEINNLMDGDVFYPKNDPIYIKIKQKFNNYLLGSGYIQPNHFE